MDISDYLWGLKSKFRLEIGLKNDFEPKYEDIVWFKQGIYVLTQFNPTLGASNYTINISGKDKMCLINGDLGGQINNISTDFGQVEMADGSLKKVLIKDIITKGIITYGHELPQNILINDLDIVGYEQLDYRGQQPIYMFKDVTTGNYSDQTTMNSGMTVYGENGEQYTLNSIPVYQKNFDDNLNDATQTKPTKISFVENPDSDTPWYQVFKVEAGDTPGYRVCGLVYAGDLIAAVGETFTSVLDKIVQMLGNYEYFYDVDGHFVFQKKKNYITAKWTGLVVENSEEVGVLDAYNDDTIEYFFDDNMVVSTLNNNPAFNSVRNDFTVWGQRKGISGAEIPIHMRCALDVKPKKYTSFRTGITYDASEVDWRELIYQMALDWEHGTGDDAFYINVANANGDLYPTGTTGYEKYYTDIEGFWRQLYNPEAGGKIDKESAPDLSKRYYYSYTAPTNGNVASSSDFITINRGQALVCDEVVISEDSLTIESEIKDDIIENYVTVKMEEDNKRLYTYSSIDKKYNIVLERDLVDGKLNPAYNYYFSEGKQLEDENGENVMIRRFIHTDEIDYYVVYPAYEKYELAKSIYHYNPELSLYQSNKFNPTTGWCYDIQENPEGLNFWFDFVDVEGTELEKYSIQAIGDRPKVENVTTLKSIYYRDIPNVVFKSSTTFANETTWITNELLHQTYGYEVVNLPSYMDNMFKASSKGTSVKDKIDQFLNDYTYCAETITLNIIPIYYLDVNTRFSVKDKKTGINGQYKLDKITIPLGNSGSMSIVGTRIVNPIY